MSHSNPGRMYLHEPKTDILTKAENAKKAYSTQLDELAVCESQIGSYDSDCLLFSQTRHKQLQARVGELEKELEEIVESGQKQ